MRAALVDGGGKKALLASMLSFLPLRNLTKRKSCNLDSLSLSDEQLVLYGNLSVLGLLIMKNKTIAPPDADSADFSIFKFMQVSENSRNLSTFIR